MHERQRGPAGFGENADGAGGESLVAASHETEIGLESRRCMLFPASEHPAFERGGGGQRKRGST